MGSYEDYLEMERLYDRLVDSNPDVIQQIKDLVDEYAEPRDEVYSNRAGHSIVPKCVPFGKLCGSTPAAMSVFGIVLNRHLIKADWLMEDGNDGNKEVKIYYR